MPRAALDERALEALRRVRLVELGTPLTVTEFKTTLREQYSMLQLDTEAALMAIPALLPSEMDVRKKLFVEIQKVLSARTEIDGEVAERLQRVAGLFNIDPAAPDNESKLTLRPMKDLKKVS